MPWVIAKLRNQRVYARADARGQLTSRSGRVEIRYRPNDGRLYLAAVGNLTVVDPTALPDETCGTAEAASRGREPVAEAVSRGREPVRAGEEQPEDRAGKAPTGEGGARPSSARRKAGQGRARAGELVAYTDGACSQNPGPAGLGVVVLRPTERVEVSEYLGMGTNNVAELTAVLRALEELGDAPAARIHTDSQYAIGVLQRGWKAKANAELVARIRGELRRLPNVTLCYVPGHQGVALNERADELARQAVSSRRSRRDVIPVRGNG